MTAPDNPEVKVVISEASYANLNELTPQLYLLPGIRQPLAWLTRLWARLFIKLDPVSVSPAQSAAKLNIPVLIIHSTNDQVISFVHAQRIQQSLKNNPQAEFWFQENLMHGQLSGAYQQRVTEFFLKHLGEKQKE
jgi:fermentation-respiration switch protein FrsA (DUF1100 family)